jgi:hypothetical protein
MSKVVEQYTHSGQLDYKVGPLDSVYMHQTYYRPRTTSQLHNW